jgi:hypothetical protein
MKMKNNEGSLLPGLVAYTVGAAVGLFLILIAAWADMESSVYGFPRLAGAGLRGLQCPILMTRGETATISFQLSNPTDDRISPSVKTQISTPLVPEEFLENLRLTPGETTTLKWPVDPGNIDMERFIFAKVLLFSSYPVPSQEATCGIFILDLPGSGRVLLPILIALSLLSMGWGLYQIGRLRAFNHWLRRHRGPLVFLAVIVVIGLVFSFLGGWIPSLLVLVLAVFMILILLGTLLAGRPI